MPGIPFRILQRTVAALGLAAACSSADSAPAGEDEDDSGAAAGAPIADSLVGVWSRRASPEMREIVEFRPNGAYTSGVCVLYLSDYCSGKKATASRVGRMVVRGDQLTVSRGLVNLHRERTAEGRESYRWRVAWNERYGPTRPDSPPLLRRLYLTGADGTVVEYQEMPAHHRPRWTPRADR